jgi:hypothetical protein
MGTAKLKIVWGFDSCSSDTAKCNIRVTRLKKTVTFYHPIVSVTYYHLFLCESFLVLSVKIN